MIGDIVGSWALVAGAGRGIGKSVAIHLAKQGIHIVAVARTAADLHSLQVHVLACGVKFTALCMDLSAPDATENLLESLRGDIADLRIVCFCAAMVAAGPFTEIPLSAHEKTYRLNIAFPMRTLHQLFHALPKHRKCFVFNFCSQAALFPVPWMSAYSASKSFIQSWSLSLAHELRESHIAVVTVVPAHTETSAFASLGVPAEIQAEFPRGKPPDSIAELVVNAVRKKPPLIVTTIRGFRCWRLIAGLTPTSLLLRMAGRMFSPFRERAYHQK